MDADLSRLERRLKATIASPAIHRRQVFHFAVANLAPALAFLVAVVWGLTHGVSAVDAVIFVIMFVGTTIGVEVGFHRGFAHGAYKAPAAVRTTLAILGAMAGQGSAAYWAANHRRHHAHTDRPGDPHSPQDGFWRAHILWVLDRNVTLTIRYAPDLLADSALRTADRRYFLWLTLGLILPGLVSAAASRDLMGLLTGFLWGGATRLFLVQQFTFLVNSLCHLVGRRDFETADHSTNIRALALLTLGGSLHNNHHAFPSAATTALTPGDIDLSGALIRMMARLGIVSEVVTPTPEALDAKRIANPSRATRSREGR